MAQPNTITIEFKAKDDGKLLRAIQTLDKATKSLLNSQAKMVDGTKKGTSAKDKHKKQVESLIIKVKALGGNWSKNTKLLDLHRKALKGDKVAMEQLRIATAKYTEQLKKGDKGLLDTAHSTRILGGSFAVLRSKLLLISFATLLVKQSIGKLVKAHGEQEISERKLQTAIGRRSRALLEFASAQQQVTVFGDEETITAMSLLGAYTDNEEQIKKLTKASMDLASAKGMDLKTATDLVAKSVFSSTNALSRYGITIEGAEGSTERLESAVGSLGRLYGGQATEQANTMSGALEQSKNAIGDTAEAIGALLSPAITTMARGFTGASEAVTKYLTQLRLSRTELEGVVDVDKREEVLLAKIAKTKADIAKGESGLRGHAGRLAENREKLIRLEEQLAINRESLFHFSKQELAVLDELEKKHGTRLQMLAEQQQATHDFAQGAGQDQQQLYNIWDEGSLVLQNVALDTDFVNQMIEDNIIANEKQTEGFSKTAREISKSDHNRQEALQNERKEMILTASLNQKSAKDTMKAVLRAEMGKSIGVLITKILSRYPFPWNVAMATGAGAIATGLFDQTVQKFAKGGDFVTNKPELIMVGEAGREHVQITPVDRPEERAMKGSEINVNIHGGIVQEDYVVNELLPAINKAKALA